MNNNERKWSRYSVIICNIKNIFEQEINNDIDCISLYDVSNLIKNKDKEYNNLKNDFIFKNRPMLFHFNYDSDELHIAYWHKYLGYKETIFSKKDRNLFITKSKDYRSNSILTKYGDDLSKLYDSLLEYKSFYKEKSTGIKTVNSIFLANINAHGVSLSTTEESEFEITSHSYTDKYSYKCDSNIVLSLFSGNEDDLFKCIFVKIKDCPKWCQDSLRDIRKKQLETKDKVKVK